MQHSSASYFYCFHNPMLEMHLLEGPDEGDSTGEGKKEK